MCSTERYREFIARLAAERAGLHELQVMRIGRFAVAQETGLLGDGQKVLLVPVAAWGAQCEHALVDPSGLMPIGAAGHGERFCTRRCIGSCSRNSCCSRGTQILGRRFQGVSQGKSGLPLGQMRFPPTVHLLQ